MITRDTIFFIIHLITMTVFLSSNSITLTNAFILIAIYVVHIFAMKWNVLYEVAIKKNVARFMEVRELTKLAQTDIDFYHKVHNSRSLSIEILSKLDYNVENKHIVFDDKYRKRIKEPKVALTEDEAPFSMMDDRGYMAKMLWKKAAMKVLIRIQAYKFYEKIKRNRRSVVDITKMLPYLANDPDASEIDESMMYLQGETPRYPRNNDDYTRAQ